MSQPSDLNRSHTALEQDCTLIAVVEMSLNSWLVAGIVPGIDRHPLKKLAVDEHALLELLRRWQAEAMKVGYTVKRIVVAFEAGRDGFWLARWLRARDIEPYVIHASGVAVAREHRRVRPIGSTPSCSNAPFSAGCAASVITARWSQSRQ